MKIIELKQAPVVLIEFSPKETLAGISKGVLYYYGEMMNKDDYPYSLYLDYLVSLVGILSDLTEEQFAECVKQGLGLYANYNETIEFGTAMRFEKASESFYSLLESEKVYTENPYKVYGETNTCSCTHDNGEEKCEIIKYEEAKSRTIDPTHTVVLLRKEKTK